MKKYIKTKNEEAKAASQMRNLLIICSVILIGGMAACSRPKPHEVMHSASLLMATRPDSALLLMEGIDPAKLDTRADSAWYALLLTQARDKNHIWQTDDSLISSAVAYYEKHHDAQKQAQAYFYWGCVYRDAMRHAEALEKFYQATELAKQGGDKRLSALIHANIGLMFRNQGLYDDSDSIFTIVAAMGELIGDTGITAEAITLLGKTALFQKHYPQAEEKLLEASRLLEAHPEAPQWDNLSNALCRLYLATRQIGKALHYARLNLSLQKDTAHSSEALQLMMLSHYRLQDYDSAAYYAHRLLAADTSSWNKKTAYDMMGAIARKQGDLQGYARLNDLYHFYKQKYDNYLALRKLGVVETQHNNQTRQLLQQARRKQWMTTGAAVLGGLCVVAVVGYFLWKTLKRNDRLRQRIRKLWKYGKDMRLQKEAVEQQNTKLGEKLNRLQQQKKRLEKQNSTLQDSIAAQEQERQCAKVLDKIHDILDGCTPKLHLTEEDWIELKRLTDPNNRLARHGLDDKELHFSYLVLCSKYTKENICLLLDIRERSVYRLQETLLQKLETKKNKGKKLQDILLEITGAPTPESQTPHE